MTTYRNPVLTWNSEYDPERMPQSEPPPGPFTVTRSKVVITEGKKAVVHIWYAVRRAEPAGRP